MRTIVIAWTDTRSSGFPAYRTVLVGRAAVWLLDGKAADVKRARQYAEREHKEDNGRVYVYFNEADPLRRARAAVVKGKK